MGYSLVKKIKDSALLLLVQLLSAVICILLFLKIDMPFYIIFASIIISIIVSTKGKMMHIVSIFISLGFSILMFLILGILFVIKGSDIGIALCVMINVYFFQIPDAVSILMIYIIKSVKNR